MRLRVLVLVGIATVLAFAAFPAQGHHEANVDTRIVQPYGLPVLFHVPVAAGYEPLPTPQHCLEAANGVTGAFYSQDFSGAHGYSFISTPLSATAPNLWQTTTTAGVGNDAGHSAGNRLWYGNAATGNYDVGHTAGTAQSPGIAIPASGPVFLSFATKWQVEWLKGYDHLWVEAKAPDGKVHLLCTGNAYDRADPLGLGGNTLIPSCSPFHFDPCPSTSLIKWETRTVQLPNALLGKTINLRFTFDSADDKANIYNGWMVDDVALGTGLA
jgi:hypothetical protein